VLESPLTVGDSVRVINGPFAGAQGQIAALFHGRAVVLLAELGRINMAMVDVEALIEKRRRHHRSRHGIRHAVDALQARLDQLAA
jgi:ribosomal protein L24